MLREKVRWKAGTGDGKLGGGREMRGDREERGLRLKIVIKHIPLALHLAGLAM